MKNVPCALILLLALVPGRAQDQQFSHKPQMPAATAPLTGEEWRLNLVGRLVSLPSPVTNGAPQLYGMGDEAAVDVLKLLGLRGPLSTAETRSVLDIVHMAFARPQSVIEPGNRVPRAAQFLLRYVDATSGDAAVKQRVAQELEFVRTSKP